MTWMVNFACHAWNHDQASWKNDLREEKNMVFPRVHWEVRRNRKSYQNLTKAIKFFHVEEKRCLVDRQTQTSIHQLNYQNDAVSAIIITIRDSNIGVLYCRSTHTFTDQTCRRYVAWWKNSTCAWVRIFFHQRTKYMWWKRIPRQYCFLVCSWSIFFVEN